MPSRIRHEPGLYRHLLLLATPMVLQNMVTTALGFVDTFMVGLLGNAEMAAVNAANTPIFIIQVILFGFQSGMMVLASQYWGKGDTDSINRCVGMAMYAITAFTATMALIMFCFPTGVMALITSNEAIVQLGAPYLRIVGFSYVFNGLSSIYAGAQRCIENPKFGMLLMGTSMLVNTFLNYIFIFGNFGAPALGVTGAAIATLMSRVLELTIALLWAPRDKRLPLRPGILLRPGKSLLRDFIKYSSPVICNEALWSLGTSMLTVIMGHMENNQDMLAANALVGYVEKFAMVFCFGVADASAVIVGKAIGLNYQKDQVYGIGKSLLRCAVAVGAVSGGIVVILVPLFFRSILFPLFRLTPGAAYAATCMLVILGCVMPLRSFNAASITGVFRAGGDVRAASFIDLAPLWGFSVPLCALVALVLRMDVVWVCLAMYGVNVIKMPMGLYRFRSRKWIRDVTRPAAGT